MNCNKSLFKNIYNNYNKKNNQKSSFKNILNIKLTFLMTKQRPRLMATYKRIFKRTFNVVLYMQIMFKCVTMKKIYYFTQ